MRSWLADWLTDVSLWILKKGGTDMVAVYVALIINGRRIYASVPALLKDKVKVDLEALGLEDLCK